MTFAARLNLRGNMAGKASPPKFRTIVEDHVCRQQLDHLRRSPRVAAALRGLIWGIAENPEQFDLVPQFEPIRIAKTDPFGSRDSAVPQIRLWFRIRDEETVDLLCVEATSVLV